MFLGERSRFYPFDRFSKQSRYIPHGDTQTIPASEIKSGRWHRSFSKRVRQLHVRQYLVKLRINILPMPTVVNTKIASRGIRVFIGHQKKTRQIMQVNHGGGVIRNFSMPPLPAINKSLQPEMRVLVHMLR